MTLGTAAVRQTETESAKLMDSEIELNKAIDDLRDLAALDATRTSVAAGQRKHSSSVTMQIPVEVNIVLGSAEMSVAELAGLQAGSTIPLDRRVGEPVDVVVNGVKIARGELVLLENEPNRFGFRITSILS